jgi:hypothetical protein
VILSVLRQVKPTLRQIPPVLPVFLRSRFSGKRETRFTVVAILFRAGHHRRSRFGNASAKGTNVSCCPSSPAIT